MAHMHHLILPKRKESKICKIKPFLPNDTNNATQDKCIFLNPFQVRGLRDSYSGVRWG